MRHWRLLPILFWIFATPVLSASDDGSLGPDGLHIQSWFHPSSFNMATDLQAAASQGKSLIILYEQKGCVYCAELHAVNFARPEIIDMLGAGFLVVQLDLNGAREVVDFDGETMTESRLARKWGVAFTPTTLVFAGSDPDMTSQKTAETFRLPGYLEPFYYFSALDYFASGEYENTGFSAFLQARVSALADTGKDPQSW